MQAVNDQLLKCLWEWSSRKHEKGVLGKTDAALRKKWESSEERAADVNCQR